MTRHSIQERLAALSDAQIVVMAAACGLAASTIHCNQPPLPQMAARFGRSNADAGLVATLTQLACILASSAGIPGRETSSVAPF